MNELPRHDLLKTFDKPVTEDNNSYPTEELVIGMVGAIGAGVSTAAQLLKEILERDYDYKVESIKASKIIEDNAHRIGRKTFEKTKAKRITELQDVGDTLRTNFGNDYIASKVIEQIKDMYRNKKSNEPNTHETHADTSKPMRRATIIDSLKHPAESELLRYVYGDMYLQFTVFAPERIRENRLDKVKKEEIPGIFTRDEGDKNLHGQHVADTVHLSDFFIRNDEQNIDRLTSVINRFIEIVFNIPVNTPTKNEVGMSSAFSAAHNSACLSRQVGAAIYSSDGELVSVGWNDVPRANGGLYSCDNGNLDHRCYKWNKRTCYNDKKKNELYEDIRQALINKQVIDVNIGIDEIKGFLKETSVKNLIEYSRSVHAEMEAIISTGRMGKLGMVGGTLYVTTFPCHCCARHIVVAGIKTVYYIEPYPKSLALELHSDSIGTTEEDKNKVAFLQYEGCAPRIMKLFHKETERKEKDGSARVAKKKTAIPILSTPMDSFIIHEQNTVNAHKNYETENRNNHKPVTTLLERLKTRPVS